MVPLAVQSVEQTHDALSDNEVYVCVDCDAQQVEALANCPSCGGVIVAKAAIDESDHDPLIGRKIGGRFTVIARLGAGSMGAVYRARQDGMHREVALKVLKPERAFDAGAKARFEREARATSALTSPHTVTVYDFGEDESTSQGPLLYLAMERLEGESLGQRLKRVTRIAPEEAVRIARQALRSLAEAHEKGVVHRDLKPDNIFLHKVPTPHGTEEVVKVLDFGIAKILQPDLKVDSLETQAGTVFGTPRYMSPEQAQSKPLDGRSDLYTIGLILFQMVTGRHCFPDDDAVVVMARHIQSLPPRPRELAPDAGISKRFEALILRALSKDPKRRPQTAQELHDELADVLVDPSEAAPPDPPASLPPVADTTMEGKTAPERRRSARLVAYALGFGVVLLGAIAIGVTLAQRGGSENVRVEPQSAPAIGPVQTEPQSTSMTTASPETKATEIAAIVGTAATTASPTTSAPSPASATTKPKKPPVRPPSVVTAAPTHDPPVAVTTTTTAPPATTAKPKPTSTYGKFD